MNQNLEDDVIEIIDIDLDGDGEKAVHLIPADDDPDDEFEIIELDISEEDEDAIDNEASAINNKTTVTAMILREIFSYAMIIVIAVAAAFTINRFVIINANVPTRSMVPTINVDDKLLGFRLAYLFSEPERGDIIIFEHQCYNTSDKEALIKRVIGIPKDTVEIVDGVLYINGEIVEEGYIAEEMNGNFGPYEIPEDCYFVMGDNRNISDDARYWDYTFVNKNEILAKAVLKYSPSWDILE